MNLSRYGQKPGTSPAVHLFSISYPSQARHELSSLALCPAQALSGPILDPALGRWTQFDITDIDPANILLQSLYIAPHHLC